MKIILCLLVYAFLQPVSLVAQTTFIPFGSTWRYLDNGTDQGTSWRTTSFTDDSWNTGDGKFGYGESGLTTIINFGPDHKNKYITTYFRKSVNVSGTYSSFTARVYRDDGLVVYVNGVEVFRSNMPTGTISYTTLASSASDNGSQVQSFTISSSAFVSGTNVIAVEVHQSKVSTSDMVFDLELTGTGGTPPPADVTPPTVQSINRHSPSGSTTTATSVTFRASFSESVTGVDAADFLVTAVSGAVSGVVSGVSGSGGSSYDVTVSSITGVGELRLDLKPSGTGIVDAAGNAISGGFTSGESYIIQQSSGGGSGTGFTSITALTPLSVSKNTAEKPQSKPWAYAGKHWVVMPNSSGTHIWRLDGTTWTRVLTLTSSSSTRADCKVVGNVVHVLLYRGASSSAYIVSAEYVSATATYKLWTQKSSVTSVALESGAETATIDIDGTGRMWIAYDGTNRVNVRWSDSPYSSWSSPIVLASDITTDDISAIIAMPGKIGVLWSNQNTKRFGFRTHKNGESPTAWSADEVPASQSALNVGSGMSDDHLNMAVASDGTVYCAVKTGYDTPGYPRLALLVRRPSGSWDNLYQVSQTGTRSIVILNEAIGKLKVIYTSVEDGGDILYRESSTSNISFSAAMMLIKGTYNNATSIKANYSSDVVILASTSSQAVGVLASDGTSVSSTSTAAATASFAGKEASDTEINTKLWAYPNPVTSTGTISFVLEEDGAYTLSLFDSKGAQLPGTRKGNAIAGVRKTIQLDGNNISKGLYLVRLQTAQGVKTIKLMVDR